MSESLKKKTVLGLVWTSLEKSGQLIIQFVVGILLSRQLSPEDYGTVGMITIFIAISSVLIDSGFGSALIQKKDRNEDDYSTCFYFNVLVGVVLYLILWFTSPLIADFYDTPILNDIVKVIAIALMLNSLCVSQIAKMQAEMRFKEIMIITIVTRLVSGFGALAMAYMGYGVWALVFQQVSFGAIHFLAIEICMRWHPKLSFSMASFKHLFSFGSKLLCSSLINTIYNNIYTLVIGKCFNANSVGYYARANSFAQLPSTTLLYTFMKVAYPVLSEIQDEEQRLRTAYMKFLRMSAFLLCPVILCLIVLAKPFIVVLIGEKWLPIVPLFQILCLGTFFEPLTHLNLNVLYVKGRTDLVLKLEMIKKPIAFVILLATIPLGLKWICIGQAIYCFVAYCFNCYYSGKFLNLGFFKQMRCNLPIIFNSLIMCLLCYCCVLLFESLILQLIVGILVSAVAYLLIAYKTKDESMLFLIDIVKRKF